MAKKVRWIASLGLASTVLVVIMMHGGCASRSIRESVPANPSYARAPAATGILAEMAARVAADHGEEYSRFALIDESDEAFRLRLALIDSAVSSIDVQTYLWYPDNAGRLLLERAVLASQRGVHVRLILDDLLTAGLDQLMVDLEGQPNIELRLFNPWENRRLGGRAVQMLMEMERLNSRMHNKLVIVDGNAAIVGGRNLGDHYFGMSHDYNFRDLDVFGVGHLARQSSALFDEFWNSEWVVSAENLTTDPDAGIARESWQDIQASNRSSELLARYPVEPGDWTDELSTLEQALHTGTSELVYDSLDQDQIEQSMMTHMEFLFERAEQELLITNAYIIPYQHGIDVLSEITGRGVDVSILTNSLASHDVPAVNTHYQSWRDDIVEAGARLYELRADAAIGSAINLPGVEPEFVGLHTKAAVIDRREAFIGSMNLDPRSYNINTEMGVIIDSSTLAQELAEIMTGDMAPANAWEVRLDDDGDPYWVNSDETVHRQPARGLLQRAMNLFFRVVPKAQN